VGRLFVIGTFLLSRLVTAGLGPYELILLLVVPALWALISWTVWFARVGRLIRTAAPQSRSCRRHKKRPASHVRRGLSRPFLMSVCGLTLGRSRTTPTRLLSLHLREQLRGARAVPGRNAVESSRLMGLQAAGLEPLEQLAAARRAADDAAAAPIAMQLVLGFPRRPP